MTHDPPRTPALTVFVRGRLLFFPLLILGAVASPAPLLRAAPSGAGVKPSASASATGLVLGGKLASGLASLEKSDYAAAERDLKAVSGRDAARASVALAHLTYETGRYAEAEAWAKKGAALAAGGTAVRYDAIGWQATAVLATGRVDQAQKIVEPLKDEVKAYRARALLVDILVRKGERDDAALVAGALQKDSEDDTEPVYKEPEALACVGRASFANRDTKYANSTFKEVWRTNKVHVENNVYWARLFLETYDPGHAAETVRDILKAAPDNPYGHLLNAEVKLEQSLDWEAADKELNAALKVNPKLARAYYVKGAIALHDLDIPAAEKAVASGLAIDPNDLDVLSLKGTSRYLDDDTVGYEKAKAEVLKRNPKYSRFYLDVAEFAEWEHRYDDIAAMMREATRLDPKDHKAWALLGFNLLRRGDEKDGRAALDTAYRAPGGRYNVRLVNMLNLYEKTIDKRFELLDGTGTASVFRFRFDKAESPLLSRYLPATLGKAWGVMVKKYGFTPMSPVQIEVFPEREHFSVRTDGVPNIGPTGVCFGRVITAVSPKNEAANWGLVLWHELAHVFAIQLSKNHVPRWFTEGLSEYETIVTRPEWHRALDPQLYVALKGGRLPKVAEMNRAFTHAKSQREVIVAYYASSQMIVYIAEKYGFPKVVEMLKLYGQGKKATDVVKVALGVSSDQLDTDFRGWAAGRLSRYDGQFMFDPDAIPEVDDAERASVAAPKDAAKTATWAAALFLVRKYKDAQAIADKAIALDEKQQLAHYIAAKLAFGIAHDVDAAKKHAQSIASTGGDGYVVESMLADIAEAKKDLKGMRAALDAATRFDPSQFDPLVDLWAIADKEGRNDDALALLRKLVKLDPNERTPWKKLLGELSKRGLWDEAIQVGEGAVFVDVYSSEVHALYARALTMKGRIRDARDEIDSGLAAKPKPEGEALLRVESARAFWKDRQTAKARDELATALKLDPKNAEAVKLKAEVK